MGGTGGVPFGINVAIGAAVVTAATIAAAVLSGGDARAGLVLVAVAVGGYAGVVADTRASLVTAGLGYLLFDGFLVNRSGTLTWNDEDSLGHLTIFVLALGLGLGQWWIRHARDRLTLHQELDELVENTDTEQKESHGG